MRAVILEGNHRRLKIVAVLALIGLASEKHLSILLGDFREAANGIVYLLIEERTHIVGAPCQTTIVALNRRNNLIDEVIVDRTLHEQTRIGAANLSLVSEGEINGIRHRFIQIRVLEDDHGRLAAELHDETLHLLRAGRGDCLPGDCAAGEADELNVWMLDQGHAALRSLSHNRIHHSSREAGIVSRLRHEQSTHGPFLG